MYKFLNYLGLSLLLATLMGCKDNVEIPDLGPEMETIHFHVRLDDMENGGCPPITRSDGSLIDNVYAYLIDEDGYEVNRKKITDLSQPVELEMAKGVKYNIAVVATCGSHSKTSDKIYYSSTTWMLTPNVNNLLNDESQDCFYAAVHNVTTTTDFSEPVVLKRPYAQINIGTQDLDSYIAENPISNITMTVKGVYAYRDISLKAMRYGQTTVDKTSTMTLPSSSDVFPVTGYKFLAKAYVIVGPRKTVDIDITLNHVNSSIPPKTISLTKISVEQNYQTNIFSKQLLTGEINNK